MPPLDEVVVETNWILDVALEQDSASSELFDYAERGEIRVLLPSFSVAESIKSIETKGNELAAALQPIGTQRNLFGLVDGCAQKVDDALVAIASLKDKVETRFWPILEDVTRFCKLLEPTTETVRLTSEIRNLLKLSPADSAVLATVCAHVRSGGCKHLMSRDKKAFASPDTKEYMRVNGIIHYDSANPIMGPRRSTRPHGGH